MIKTNKNDKYEILKSKLKSLPNIPGVYFFKDNKNSIIYIGKSKSLRKRVSSYFKSNNDLKTVALMSNVRYIDYMTTKTEKEALLWENTLIKTFKPKYNIDLKDSKTYPYLKLVNGDYPYLIVTRKYVNDGSQYFGPYVDVQPLRKIVKLVGRLFPIRKCRKTFKEGRTYKPCLNYHMGYCLAPCKGDVSKRVYSKIVRDMKSFLEGKHILLARKWEREIKALGKKQDFEGAKKLKKNLHTLNSMTSFDVSLWEVDEAKVKSIMKAISPLYKFPLSSGNRVGERGYHPSLESILGSKHVMKNIACFDISNMSGKLAVGSRVFFTDGKPNKDRYRRYKIKYTEEKPNDVLMMREIVHRCLKSDDSKDIDLFLIDGGKGQVNAVFDEIRKAGRKKYVLGIAKKEELLYLPKTKSPVRLRDDSTVLKLLIQIRDEAHRFAISYHRLLRSKQIKENKGK